MFSENLDEFDSARLVFVFSPNCSSEIVQGVLDEYQLMEDQDYPILSDNRRSLTLMN